MTVAELKKALEGLDEDREIYCYTNDGYRQELKVSFEKRERSDGYCHYSYYFMVGQY